MHIFFQHSLIDCEFLGSNLITIEKRRNIDKKDAQHKFDFIALEPILLPFKSGETFSKDVVRSN